MVDPVLIDRITTKIQEGERRVKIKEDLLVEGWPEGDIDIAYSHIHREALQQIPVVAWGIRKVHEIELRTANLSTKAWILVLSLAALFLLIIAIGMYIILDPLSSKASARDQEREAVFKQINRSIARYYVERGSFPESLDVLVPTYLSALPPEVKTNRIYEYTLSESGGYQFCVSLETKPVVCGTSENFEIPVNPTIQPEPEFERQPEIPQASSTAQPTIRIPTRSATTSAL